MSKTILIPTPLRPFINQQPSVLTECDAVIHALHELAHNFPTVEKYLFDEQKKIRKFMNIYVNDTDIRDLDGPQTTISDGDTVSLIPAIAGG